LDGDSQTLQVAAAEADLGGGAHGLEHAERGHGQGLLRGRRRPCGMARHFPNDCQVREGSAHVVGGDVAAAEPLDDATHGVQQRRRLVAARVGDDHRLAAAIGQSADRCLVGHAAREAQHVRHRVLFAGIRIHAAATEGRAKRGIVHRDQRPQAARRILGE
jgi:hypothetical protein